MANRDRHSTEVATEAARRLVRDLLARPAPSQTAGGQALVLAAGVLAASALAHRRGARRAEGAARAEARRRQEAALEAIAHELKTPLTAAKGHAQLLRRALTGADGPEAARLRAALAAIDAAATTAASRLDPLVDDTAAPGPTGPP